MTSGEPFYLDPTFWVAGSFAAFVGLGVWKRVHKSVGTMLDDRGAAIARQIEEARLLREEAEKALSEEQRRQRDAEAIIADIRAQATSEVEALKSATDSEIEALKTRRTKAAKEKIAQMETDILKKVRATTTDVAVAAAEAVLTQAMKGREGSAVVAKQIKNLGPHLR